MFFVYVLDFLFVCFGFVVVVWFGCCWFFVGGLCWGCGFWFVWFGGWCLQQGWGFFGGFGLIVGFFWCCCGGFCFGQLLGYGLVVFGLVVGVVFGFLDLVGEFLYVFFVGVYGVFFWVRW